MLRRLVLAVLVLGGVWAAHGTASAADGTALVFGANGKLGTEMIKALLDKNMAVTAFVRPGADRSSLANLKVSYAEGDARNKVDVDKAMASAKFTVVVNAMARRSRTETGLTTAAKATLRQQPKPMTWRR